MNRKRPFEPTKKQDDIIRLDGGAFLVIAPPGSGKTTVLTERVARLVASPTELFRVLALTFTNKASATMRNRLFEAVGEHSERVTACTFHAFCLDVLRSYGDEVGFFANTSIYENEGDQIAALHRGLVDDGLLRDAESPDIKMLRRLLASVGKLKRDLRSPDDVSKTLEDRGIPLRAAYAAYERTLRLYNAVDFDDLIVFAFRLFATVPRVAAHYRRMYRYVVIDEAQDTTPAQYAVLRTLCGESHRNVMLVADADQSIFQFAGATTENLISFESDFTATRVAMTQNFRCAETIVKSANLLIQKNPKRVTTGEAMTAALLAPGHVAACSYANEAAEARGICASISKLLNKGLDASWVYSDESTALALEDICVLGRTRYALESVLSELSNQKIAYQFSTGRKGLFETLAFRAFDSALRYVHNPKDILAQRALLDLTQSGETPVKIQIKDAEANLLLFLTLHAPKIISTIYAPLVELSKDVSALGTTIAATVAAARTVKVDDEHERAMLLADAAALSSRWDTFSRRTPQVERTIGGFLSDLALTTRSGVDGPGVRVLTIHAAKGSEFRAIFLAGMNEETFPDYRSSESADDIAEERRNAYVAITRAERVLRMTRPRTRLMPWGEEKTMRASRFITEAGVKMVDV
jgi:DNA helicase-2/ATP-dependent DNA helicase PcrA